MATAKLILNHFKEKKSGEMPLYIRIIHHRRSKYISLGLYVHPSQWNEETLRVRRSYTNSTEVNSFISTKLAEAERMAVKMATKSKRVTSRNIKEEILGKPAEDFIAFAQVQIQRLEQSEKERTAERYRSITNKLKRYLKGRNFTFDDLTVPFLHDYEAYLKSIGNDANTIHTNLKTIRAILYTAIKEDRFPKEKNPFFRFKLKKAPTKKERLSTEEIKLITDIKLREGTNIYHTRNAFLFSYYYAGVRVGDLVQLKWENKKGILDYQMGKTKQFRRLKLLKQAQQILDIYRDDSYQLSDFIFPFLKNDVDYSDAKYLNKQISSKTTILNKHLRELSEKTGIDKKISTHIARHSFADMVRKKGNSSIERKSLFFVSVNNTKFTKK